MTFSISHHRPTAPSGPNVSAADEGGDHAAVTAQQSLETVGIRFEGSEAGDTLGLQVRDPVNGQWMTLVDSTKSTDQMVTDLGTFEAGTDIEFRLVNHSQGTSHSSKSGMAKVQQNGDGTVTIAFEDRVNGDRDFNDFVFTVYKKDPKHTIVTSDLTGQTIETGNNQDTLMVLGQALRNQFFLGWDNDFLLFGGTESEDNEIEAGDGDDEISGSGRFRGDRFDGGAGNDTIRLQGSFDDVVFEGGEAEVRRFDRAGVVVENDGGDDHLELSGEMRNVRVDAGGGRDVVSIDALAESLRLDAGAGDDEVLLQGAFTRSAVQLGDGDDSIVVAGLVHDTTFELGDGNDQLVLQGRTENVRIDMGRGGDSVVLGVEWTGEVTISDPKRAQLEKDGDVKDYDQLVLEGAGWEKVDKRTYRKVVDGEIVGTVHVADDRKDVEIVRDTEDNTFQEVEPDKPKRSFFSKVVDFALGAVTFFAPPVGAALNAIKTGIDIATGKIKGFGNILLSVGSAAFGNLKGAFASVASKVVSGVSKVKSFLENPSLLGGLSLASFTAGVTGNPVTQSLLSGAQAIWSGIKNGDLSQIWNVLSSARSIQQVDAQRTARAAFEAAQAQAGQEQSLGIYRLFRGDGVIDVKAGDDPTLQPGDWVRTPLGNVGILRPSGRVDVIDPLSGELIEMDFSLTADRTNAAGPRAGGVGGAWITDASAPLFRLDRPIQVADASGVERSGEMIDALRAAQEEILYAPGQSESTARREALTQIQHLLVELGLLDPSVLEAGGGVGTYEPRTERAIAAFQESLGLPATGTIDLLTYQSLAIASDTYTAWLDAEALGVGDRGPQVDAVQEMLRHMGFLDAAEQGVGTATQGAVREFQQWLAGHGFDLPTDGTIDNFTVKALREQYESFLGESVVTPSSDTESVRSIQRILQRFGFYQPPYADGVWGDGTQAAVSEFQRAFGLEVTGSVNRQTSLAIDELYSDWRGAPVDLNDADTVRFVQGFLRSSGLYDGQLHGVFDQSTFDAVQAYESSLGRQPSTDRVSNETLWAMYDTSRAPRWNHGSQGEDVRQIQVFLSAIGHGAGDADGVYGGDTAGAVRSFQRSAGLPATGFIDMVTLERMNQARVEAQVAQLQRTQQQAAAQRVAAPRVAAATQTGVMNEINQALQQLGGDYQEHLNFPKNLLQGAIDWVRGGDDQVRNIQSADTELRELWSQVRDGQVAPETARRRLSERMIAYHQEAGRVYGVIGDNAEVGANIVGGIQKVSQVSFALLTGSPLLAVLNNEAQNVAGEVSALVQGVPQGANQSATLMWTRALQSGQLPTLDESRQVASAARQNVTEALAFSVSGQLLSWRANQLIAAGVGRQQALSRAAMELSALQGGLNLGGTALDVSTDPSLTNEQRGQILARQAASELLNTLITGGSARLVGAAEGRPVVEFVVDQSTGLLQTTIGGVVGQGRLPTLQSYLEGAAIDSVGGVAGRGRTQGESGGSGGPDGPDGVGRPGGGGQPSVESGFQVPIGPRTVTFGEAQYHVAGIVDGEVVLQRSGAEYLSVPGNQLPGVAVGDRVNYQGNAYIVEESRRGSSYVLRPDSASMTVQVPLSELGSEGAIVRLADRPASQRYRLRSGDQGQWLAQPVNAEGLLVGSEFGVRPDEIADRWVVEDNMILGQVSLDPEAIDNARVVNQRDVVFPDVQAAPGQVLDRRRGFGTAQTTEIVTGQQAQLLEQFAREIETARPGDRVQVNILRFDNFDDAEGTFTERGTAAQTVLDAALDAAARDVHLDLIVNPTVAIQERVTPETWSRFQEEIARGTIRIQEFAGEELDANLGGVFNHSKTIVFPDENRMLVSTNPVWIDKGKIDSTVTVTGDAVPLYSEYLDLLSAGTINDRRSELVDQLRDRGVVLNDPITGRYNVPGAQFGLIHDAQSDLDMMVSDLRDAGVAELLVERARAGVRVQLVVRELDDAPRQVIEQAVRETPGLPLDVYLHPGEAPYYHGNFVIADEAQAMVGTSYFWRNQQDNLTTSSYEMGVVLSGQDAQEFIRQANELREITGVGQRIE